MFQLLLASPPEEKAMVVGIEKRRYAAHTPNMLLAVMPNVFDCCEGTTCFYR